MSTFFPQNLPSRSNGDRKRKGSSSNPVPVKEELLKERKHEYGNLDPQDLLQKLIQEGITGAKLQHTPTSISIYLVCN